MSSRTLKILELSKNAIVQDECDMDIDIPEDISSNQSDSELLSETNILISEALSPEDIESMIKTAEIVMVCDNDNSTSHPYQVMPSVPITSGNVTIIYKEFTNRSDEKTGAEQLSEVREDVTIHEGEHVDEQMLEKRADGDVGEERTERAVDDIGDERAEREDVHQEVKNGANQLTSDEGSGSDVTSEQTAKGAVKGVNKRKISQKLRMQGEKYLGFTKPKGQKNSFHNRERNQRKLGPRCKCKGKGRKCSAISENIRELIFNAFWSTMNWDQRKMFVCNTVQRVDSKRSTKHLRDEDQSRRSGTFKYHLKVGNESVPVCKQMYLNTLNLGEYSVRDWTLKSSLGMTASRNNLVQNRTARVDLFKEDRDYARQFLESLHKLPSHYCRKDTNKLYLEQHSFSQLYKLYKSNCEENKLESISQSGLKKLVVDLNIGLFHPRKDQCDICFKYKNQNLSDDEYNEHILRKNSAREEKEKDKQNAIAGKCHVMTMDVQAVKLAPQLKASSLYYRTKLCCHNFTVYGKRSSSHMLLV